MQSLIFSIIFVFAFLLCVPARSIDNDELVSKLSRRNMVELPTYAKLLTLLKNRETKLYENDDDDSNSDQNIDEMPQRASRRLRPSNIHGQKSHWDTFFG
ncbi:unnamed protein product [Rotaria sp. Silwood1]|nr:unnamed protein product [Rotaria sp. Silwood1]CAF1475661.1 unnamed protein product [Rotaria sp. Silwood1]CAF3986409.1 unnamed protein product [Rotaria sp. Silwood1]CAF5070485.1 unnamed protein product [Rotaria sp. Silwood1]